MAWEDQNFTNGKQLRDLCSGLGTGSRMLHYNNVVGFSPVDSTKRKEKNRLKRGLQNAKQSDFCNLMIAEWPDAKLKSCPFFQKLPKK